MKLTALFSLSALAALASACTPTNDRADAYDSLTEALGGGVLDDTGAQHAAFMREEEKLARDVYLALGARYDHRTFNNIARTALEAFASTTGHTQSLHTNALDLGQVFADPQVVARGMQIAPGGVPGVRSPMTFSGADLALDRPAPKLGEHQAMVAGKV